MLHTFLSQLFSDLMWATAIWSGLLILAMFVIVLLLGGADERGRTLTAVDPRRLAAQAEDLQRYAREVSVAAQRAQAMALRRREEWLAAQAQVDAAWRQFDTCDAETRRLEQAAVYPVRRMRASRGERERYLHRAAMFKCSHRQLSALELSDALAHRNGWDPARHPVDQEVALQRAARDHLLAVYRSAAERERKAWQDAEVAAAASASLREEAAQAMHRARHAGFACRVALREAGVDNGRFSVARRGARRIGRLLLPAGHH